MPDSNYLPISDYGCIGDCRTIALISKSGSMDFLCYPEFDSPSIFAKVLDHKKGGFFDIKVRLDHPDVHQFYVQDTAILMTRYSHQEATVECIDFMPIPQNEMQHAYSSIIRIVKCVRGSVEVDMNCVPKPDYSRSKVQFKSTENKAIQFPIPGQDITLSLQSTHSLHLETDLVTSNIHLEEKETAVFILHPTKNEETIENLPEYAKDELLRTKQYWKQWIANSKYSGSWTSYVNRSAITLKLLTSRTHGSPIAAATFSLPETIGGRKNWDYRFTWIRDAAFTMYAFIRMGFIKESAQFMKWIWEQLGERIDSEVDLQIMYTYNCSDSLKEEELDHWEGYQKSSPVRIGNAATDQLQLDIYGELMDTIYLFDKYGEPIHYNFWVKVIKLISYVCENWNKEDHGIWEVREYKEHFLYSRIMCWVAVDRGIRLAEKRSFSYDFEKWREVRKAIHDDIYYQFWNEDMQSFVQYKGAKSLDSSVLIMPLVKFISPYDPRWKATLMAVEKHMMTDVLAYRNTKREPFDMQNPEEGTFLICAFWYVECLCRGGRQEEAAIHFEKLLQYSNHLHLFAEEVAIDGTQLGNFPQAFTHLGLISAAFALSGDKHSIPEYLEEDSENPFQI